MGRHRVFVEPRQVLAGLRRRNSRFEAPKKSLAAWRGGGRAERRSTRPARIGAMMRKESPEDDKEAGETMPESDQRNPIAVDNPINDASEDRLARKETVMSFVRQVLEMDVSQGLSVGVFGPWGSGKTSFIRLVKEELDKREDVTVVEFNPWMFSDSEQLVARFFMELSKNLQRKGGLEKVGKALAGYGGAVVGAVNFASVAFAGIPALGQVLAPLVKQLEKSTEAKGLNELRTEVEQALAKHGQRLVVVLDDVDRLSFQEIRDVFKLVRLTASFRNLVYVVVCDRHRVEEALAERGQHGAYGRQYLEKIIQFPFDLPEVPRHLLEEQLEEALKGAVPDVETLLDEEIWPEIYDTIVEPLLGNMRDVRRYAAVVRATAWDLREKAAIGDVLALEAIRLFMPDVFKLLHGAVDALTYPAYSKTTKRELARFRRGGIGPDLRSKKLVGEILKADEERRLVAEAMVKYLFPYGNRVAHAEDGQVWEEESDHGITGDRRVADEAVLRLYLERVEGHDLLVLADAERTLQLMADDQDLDGFLRSFAPSRRVEVIREFCKLSHRFQPVHAKTGVAPLLNLLPEMPNEPTLSERPRRVVLATVFRLLRAIDGPEQVEALAKSILPKIGTLSSKAELSALIGHSAHESERLVPKEASAEFDAAVAEEIRVAFSNDEIDEHDEFAWVVSFPARVNLQPIALRDSAELDFRLVHSAQGTSISSETGVSRHLNWKLLQILYGSEETARARVERVCEVFGEEWDERLRSWGIPAEAARETIEVARAGLRCDH